MSARRTLRILGSAALASAVCAGAGPGAFSQPPETILFRGAVVWTMGPQGILEGADVLVREGRIARVGRGLRAPEDALVVEAGGRHLTPGLIDAHSHTAVDGGVNEGSNNVTAEVRIEDVLDPDDVAIYRQLAGGLTTANVLHGSANSIGGQNAVIKLRWGAGAGDLLFEGAPPGIKFALGENPKRSNLRGPGGEARFPATRMGVAASIREAFLAARKYRRQWRDYEALSEREKSRREPPRRDLQLDPLVEVLEGERLVHAHCYRQDEILMLLRLAEEFGFRIATLQHVLEGYKVADEIAAHGAGASTFSDWWAYKAEAYDATPYNGALMSRRGVLVSFHSDSSELARRMNLEAAKAVKYGGLTETEALALVTINPARQLRIDDRVGSIEEGKDADLALWSGHPLSTYSTCEQTWVDGIKKFDRSEDLASREGAEAERAALIEKVKSTAEQEAERGKKAGEAPRSEGAGSSGTSAAGFAAAAPPAESAPAGGTDPAAASPSKEIRPQPHGAPAAYGIPDGWGSGATALVGATLHTVSGPDIARGTIVFRDGVIVAVGGDVAAPPGMHVVDLQGLHVYPGMIDADSVVGLTEIGSVAGTVDVSETGLLNPHMRVELAVNPDSELIPVTRANGITHLLTAPRGRVVSGTGALIRLDGWTWEDLTASAPLGMHVEWPRWRVPPSFGEGAPPTEEEIKKEREAELKALGNLIADARAYRKALEAGARSAGSVSRDVVLESFLPVVEGRMPVFVHASDLRQIESALDWAEKEEIRIVLAGPPDAWRAAGRLRARAVPVILGPILRNPDRRHEPYDTPFAAARRLHEAGVTFCIGGGGRSSGSNARNLPYGAAMAAAFGLPKEEALRSVTLYPARILGVEDRLGSIEVGKSASLIVTDGDPLEIRTRVLRVFIDGRESDLLSRHRRLYERYAARPRATGAR